MLHDALIRQSNQAAPQERRGSPREDVSPAELVVLWHHDMETAIRYPLVDLNEEGVRILTAAPLVEGMTGTAVNLLPTGKPINRPCTVRWARRRDEAQAYEAGLRFL
jgi:hypothetical protein